MGTYIINGKQYNPKCGDIFLCSSERFVARLVIFFMTAPTIYQYIWRAIRGTQQKVRYYHAGLIINDEQIIEQQGKVQYGETQKILSRKISIYRKKNLTDQQRIDLGEAAKTDLGEGYGILSIFGKMLTWLTGITIFEDLMHIGDSDICVNRVAYWYWKSNGELFGEKNFKRTTTKTMDEYCAHYTDEWEEVYKN